MKKFLVTAVLLSGIFAAVVWSAVFIFVPAISEGSTFTVETGESVTSIVRRLKDEGIVRNGLVFRFALKRSGLATKIQPGVHSLDGVNTYGELAQALASGAVGAEEDVLLLREGETLRNLKAALDALGHPAAAGLYDVTGVPAEPGGSGWDVSLAEEFPFLEGIPAGASLEGYLFPDTYRIFKDATAEDVVRVMLRHTATMLDDELLADIDASGRTLYEIVIIASIVEREVQSPEDMALVADLFWRRDDIGMGLQADSTVNYVTGKKDAAISYEDTQVDSLYNTYKYRGLPYGPISNPGIAAIRATVYPTPNSAVYFLTDMQGTVHYAETLDGHNANKARYLR